MKILIVEDYPSIVRMLRKTLTLAFPDQELTILETGYIHLAMDLIHENPDIRFAILDRNVLDGGIADVVADKLLFLEIPFVRYVGFPDEVPAKLRGIVMIEKPGKIDDLVNAWRFASQS